MENVELESSDVLALLDFDIKRRADILTGNTMEDFGAYKQAFGAHKALVTLKKSLEDYIEAIIKQKNGE